MSEAKGTLLDGEDNAMVARRLSAEEWMAEVDSIINQYHEGSGHRGRTPMSRKQNFCALVPNWLLGRAMRLVT